MINPGESFEGVDVVVNTMSTEGFFQAAKNALVDTSAECSVKIYFPKLHLKLSGLTVANVGLILKLIFGLLDMRFGLGRRRIMRMPLKRDSRRFLFSMTIPMK